MPDVTHTASAVARIRAEEAGFPRGERLFEDPYAHLFDGGTAADETMSFFLQVPFLREAIRLRTRYIDDVVCRGVEDGLRQLVLLGAGFDCRALRLTPLEAAQVSAFEVDFASQLTEKRRLLDEAGIAIPPRVRHVPSDFNLDFAGPLTTDLEAAGFTPGAGAIFVWEGVANYLDDDAVARTLRFVARSGGPGSRLVLNYQIGRFDPVGLARRLDDAGLDVVEDTTFDVLFERYLHGAPPAGGELYRIASATVRRAAAT
jgi:methyltransferase (TIGR00027 family)